MTPDDHYREAERLLGLAASTRNGSREDRLVARAHVHAVLAVREAAPIPRRQQARAV
jgi:hypothetical protein